MASLKYSEEFVENLEPFFDSELILIVTATDLETRETHQKLGSLSESADIKVLYQGDQTYYFGTFGNYKIAHVQCTMGSISRASSITTISDAIALLKCKVVIMIGIAFGVDSNKQSIGDVLVAESIIPYNVRRVGSSDVIQRGIEAPTSKTLLNRFKSARVTWEHFLTDEKKASIIPTRLLSGEELIDNVDHRNKLIEENPDSKGGEMEGAGVYAACDGKADWILIKGICDFADGEKGKNKEQNQTIAILSALSLCLELFNTKSAFKELGISPWEQKTEKGAVNNKSNINEVLFDLYDTSKEPFYVHRDDDVIFSQKLKAYSIWVHGPSGCGKSNLILRNLTKLGYHFIQISLASYIGQDVESFFFELLYEIASKTEGVLSQRQPKNFSECNKALFDLLKKYYDQKELIIFIEEIPIASNENYKEFGNKFSSLLISKSFVRGLSKIKFVLSSINDPTFGIEAFQKKVFQQMVLQPLEVWSKEQISTLILLIENNSNYKLPASFREELITKCGGSPRFIKKFFRSLTTIDKADIKSMEYILAETQRELNI